MMVKSQKKTLSLDTLSSTEEGNIKGHPYSVMSVLITDMWEVNEAGRRDFWCIEVGSETLTLQQYVGLERSLLWPRDHSYLGER